MHCTTQNFIQPNTIFGSGYVHDQHSDETHRYLPPTEQHDFVVDFNAVIKALRAALSLR